MGQVCQQKVNTYATIVLCYLVPNCRCYSGYHTSQREICTAMTRCSVSVMGSTTCCFCMTEFSIASAHTNIAAGCFTANVSTLPGLAGPVQQPVCLPYLTLQVQCSTSGSCSVKIAVMLCCPLSALHRIAAEIGQALFAQRSPAQQGWPKPNAKLHSKTSQTLTGRVTINRPDTPQTQSLMLGGTNQDLSLEF